MSDEQTIRSFLLPVARMSNTMNVLDIHCDNRKESIYCVYRLHIFILLPHSVSSVTILETDYTAIVYRKDLTFKSKAYNFSIKAKVKMVYAFALLSLT